MSKELFKDVFLRNRGQHCALEKQSPDPKDRDWLEIASP